MTGWGSEEKAYEMETDESEINQPRDSKGKFVSGSNSEVER